MQVRAGLTSRRDGYTEFARRGSAVLDVVYADGDASLPRQMEAGATQGVPLLQAMVAAEIADLMDDAPTDAAMALAAGPLSDAAYDALVKAVAPDSPTGRALAKIGARNSRADQERIQRMHDDAWGLGATCESAEKGAGADPTKGSDAVEAVRVELAKMTGQRRTAEDADRRGAAADRGTREDGGRSTRAAPSRGPRGHEGQRG